MQKRASGQLEYYVNNLWSDLRHGIFTRKGGVSQAPWHSLNTGGSVGDAAEAVRENHQRIYRALDVDADRVCSVWQVHSAEVIVAEGPAVGRHWLAQADGMITNRPDTPLVMRFADCTPLLLYDPQQRAIGIGHAGWRGTVAGVGTRLVRAMQRVYGCDPADIQAWIGPSIGPEHYQVGEDVIAAAAAYFGATDGLIGLAAADASPTFDLWAANRLDLHRAGVRQIEIAGLCTAVHTDEFFSHRAEQGRTGRFSAVMSL